VGVNIDFCSTSKTISGCCYSRGYHLFLAQLPPSTGPLRMRLVLALPSPRFRQRPLSEDMLLIDSSLSLLNTRISPPQGIVAILPIVYNLLKRHPTGMQIIHRPDTLPGHSDPFDAEETDPLDTRALESSLWELAVFHLR
jgi:hypothetical protein